MIFRVVIFDRFVLLTINKKISKTSFEK